MEILSELKKIPELKNVPDLQLQWLIDNGKLEQVKQGEFLFKKGNPIDRMLIVLQGHFVIKIHQNGQYRVVGNIDSPSITGLLPYSRANEARGFGEASVDSQILALEREQMRDLIVENQQLTEALVHMMSSRIRSFTRLEQQNDKIMALGKLSASLAHELNNPSSAVVRSAQTLSKHLKALPEKFKSVIKIKITDEQVDQVNEILFGKLESGIQTFSMMEKSEKEDELMDWLDDNQVDDVDVIAENFVDYGVDEDDLDTILELVRKEDLSSVIHWINQVLTTERLVTEIEEASQRINDLVTSVKSYTHMDQAPEKKPTDIHIGINNTVTMLNHKMKKQNIDLVRNFDTEMAEPHILIGEMNQVWTNLIDNAIDAMENSDSRTLTIDTRQNGQFVNIEISDTGSGIPEDALDKIFDPFFTTKSIGKGTGVGLEVVHRIITQQHHGTIDVESKPGLTKFKICFPIEPQ